MSEFSDLKTEYIALAGKNPPPMSLDALRAKVAEAKAAAAAPAQAPPAQEPPADDPRAQDPPAQDPPADDGQAQDPPADEVAAEQSVEDACAELGLEIDSDGNAAIEMLVSMCGPDTNLVKGDPHRCDAAEAVRLVRAGFAQPDAH